MCGLLYICWKHDIGLDKTLLIPKGETHILQQHTSKKVVDRLKKSI